MNVIDSRYFEKRDAGGKPHHTFRHPAMGYLHPAPGSHDTDVAALIPVPPICIPAPLAAGFSGISNSNRHQNCKVASACFNSVESDPSLSFLEHDLVRKPVSTFRDHAPAPRCFSKFVKKGAAMSLELRKAATQCESPRKQDRWEKRHGCCRI